MVDSHCSIGYTQLSQHMPGPEGEKPYIHAHQVESTDMPAKVTDGQHTALIHKNEAGDVLYVHVAKGDIPLASLAITTEGEVNLLVHPTRDGKAIPVFEPTKHEAFSAPAPVTPEPVSYPEETEVDTPIEPNGAPTTFVGKVKETGTLGKTTKKQQTIYRFKIRDEQNKVERNIAAFDTIAEQLAAPETNFTVDTDIKMQAHKHVFDIHIGGQKRKAVWWYVQRMWYDGKVYEKPRPKRERKRNTDTG